MESTLGGRISQILMEKRLRKSKLAELLNVSRGAVTQYLTGDTKPAIKNLEKIAEILGVNLGWLVSGEGKKYIQVPDTDEVFFKKEDEKIETNLILAPNNEDIEVGTNEEKIKALQQEIEKLTMELNSLKRELADKNRIIKEKEDKENMAKELIKQLKKSRKFP